MTHILAYQLVYFVRICRFGYVDLMAFHIIWPKDSKGNDKINGVRKFETETNFSMVTT